MKETNLSALKTRYGIVGLSDKLETALTTALQVSDTDLSVLIQGESGVGKEILPRIIHEHSRRSSIEQRLTANFVWPMWAKS